MGIAAAEWSAIARPDPELQPLRITPLTVERNTRTHHIQIHLRIAGQGAAVGTVPDGKCLPPVCQSRQHPLKNIELLPGIGLTAGIILVGGGKVGKNPLRLQVPAPHLASICAIGASTAG